MKTNENEFSVSKYFTRNYGLNECPAVWKLHGFWKLLYLLIFPFIISLLSRARRAKWQKEYNNRRDNWPKLFDREYEKKVASLNISQRAIEALGIDDSFLANNAKPFSVHSKEWKLGYFRKGPDGVLRTDVNSVTYFAFTEKQLLTYKVSFSMTGAGIKSDGMNISRKEDMREIFYDDIVSVTLTHEDAEVKQGNDYGKEGFIKKKKNKQQEVPETEKAEDADKQTDDDPIVITNESFTLVVPGYVMSYSYYLNSENANSVAGMRNLIRKKKAQAEEYRKNVTQNLNNK